MNDLAILHLSDLHFDISGAQPFKLYEALLSDIGTELKYSQNLVIVVTGDLVNRANYVSKELVLTFFKELKRLVTEQEKQICGICFVPGNHDKVRTYPTGIISSTHTELNNEYYKNFKKYFKNAYKKYHKLVKEVLALFDIPYSGKYTYGSTEVIIRNTDNKKKYFRFICLNTAWAAQGDNDRRNLKVGAFQINQIQKQYKKQQNRRKKDQKDEVTFVLAHHPLNWLSGPEEDYVRNFLIGQRGINADIFICGHTHTRDIINWSNNRHSLTTLSTGIGEPDNFDSDHSNLHAYAIYVLHLDLNALDIYVRSTNDGGTFVPDHRIYTSEENRKNNKIVLPIKSTSVQSYFALSSINKRSPKVCFLTNDFLEDIRKFVFAIGCFRQFAIECIERDVRALDSISKGPVHGQISAENQEIICFHFQNFLQSICDLLAEEILGHYIFESDDRIRFHFRYCTNPDSTGETLKYVKLCFSYWPDISAKEKNLSVIEWGQLIKDAYTVKRPLIYSANPDNCNKTTKWLDFITIIPNFMENTFTVDTQHVQETRPYITFGVSITSEKFKNILYCLDYYRFDKILEALIRRYLIKIPVDIREFIKFINHKLCLDNMED